MAVIAVTKERRAGETRVAAVPETVKKLTDQITIVVGAANKPPTPSTGSPSPSTSTSPPA